MQLEAWPRGLRHLSTKQKWVNPHREFESHRFRSPFIIGDIMTIRKSHSRKIKAKGGGFRRVTVKSAFVKTGKGKKRK